jgi:hypothetical protein
VQLDRRHRRLELVGEAGQEELLLHPVAPLGEGDRHQVGEGEDHQEDQNRAGRGDEEVEVVPLEAEPRQQLVDLGREALHHQDPEDQEGGGHAEGDQVDQIKHEAGCGRPPHTAKILHLAPRRPLLTIP